MFDLCEDSHTWINDCSALVDLRGILSAVPASELNV